MGVRGTALLAISTPDDEINYYSEFFEIKDKQGRPMFYQIKVGLSCDECTLRGINCPPSHKIRRLPAWKTAERQEKTEAIMANRPDQANRELLGMVTSSRQYLFKKFTAQLFERNPYIFEHTANVVHIGIDPSGGGTSSDYAIVSLAHEEQQWVITGIDHSSSFHHNEVMQMLADHVLGLRQLSQYKDALFVFYIEANMSFLSVSHLCNFFNQPQFGLVKIVSRDPKNMGRPGVWTGPQEKEIFARDLEQVMSDGKLSFADQMVSDNPEHNKVKLLAQLNFFSRIVIPPNDPSQHENRIVYSGKGVGRRDDLCLALMLALTHGKMTLFDQQFVEECHRNGWRY